MHKPGNKEENPMHLFPYLLCVYSILPIMLNHFRMNEGAVMIFQPFNTLTCI
jgi:hypothetical protein